jgi:hypothetical protein
MSGDEADDETYLFVVSYDDDAERKRAEYLFNNWSEGKIERPEGLVRIVSGTDHDELYEQLITKVPEEQVASYAIESIEPDVEPETVRVERTIHAPRQAVESFLDYVFSKRKAVLQSADRNEYDVYTKKGRAEVRYSLDETDGATTVRVRIEGYPPAPAFLADFFGDELDEFSASQR